MVVKRELNAQGNVKTMSSTLQSKIAAITIKMGNINDVIKEFEQNICSWNTNMEDGDTQTLGHCMRVFWPSLVRFGEIQ